MPVSRTAAFENRAAVSLARIHGYRERGGEWRSRHADEYRTVYLSFGWLVKKSLVYVRGRFAPEYGFTEHIAGIYKPCDIWRIPDGAVCVACSTIKICASRWLQSRDALFISASFFSRENPVSTRFCGSVDKLFEIYLPGHCQNRIFQRDKYRGGKLPEPRARSPPPFLGCQ